MEGKQKWIACLHSLCIMFYNYDVSGASGAEFDLNHAIPVLQASHFEISEPSAKSGHKHQNNMMMPAHDMLASFDGFSHLPKNSNTHLLTTPVDVGVFASHIQVSPQHIVTQLNISPPLSADIGKESYLQLFDSAIYYHLHGNISTDRLLPIAMDISAVIDCSCLNINMRHAALAGQLSWTSQEDNIQINLTSQDSTASLNLSMEIAPVPALKSPILITDGNAVLTDDDQILDFHGTFAAAFSQKDNCVRCVDGVFAGTSDSTPDIQSLLVALQNRQ